MESIATDHSMAGHRVRTRISGEFKYRHILFELHLTNELPFQATKPPPEHMKICRGHIILRSRKEPTDSLALGARTQSTAFCDICFSILSNDESSKPSCLNSNCRMMCHLICLANEFLERDQYIPISGRCPLCCQTIIWGELVRKRKGCADTIILIDDE